MNEDLKKLIQEANRELRQASGIPLTQEENDEVYRTAEIGEFDRFAYRTFGYRRMLPLKFNVVWDEKSAIGQMSVDDRTFNLRREGEDFRLFLVELQRERELLQLESSDQNFASRVLVAIGDTLSKSTE
jgi:hypothetical protein